jgi:hypothetical protein
MTLMLALQDAAATLRGEWQPRADRAAPSELDFRQ